MQQSLSSSSQDRTLPFAKKIRSAILVVIFVPVWAGQPSWFIAQPSPKDLVTRLPLTSLRIRRKFDNCMWPAKRAPAEPPSDKGNIKLLSSFRAMHETISSGESKALPISRNDRMGNGVQDKSPKIWSSAKLLSNGRPNLRPKALSLAALPYYTYPCWVSQFRIWKQRTILRTSKPWPLNCDARVVLLSCDAFYTLSLTKLLLLDQDPEWEHTWNKGDY